MATNHYFNNAQGNLNEQRLMEDIFVECIQQKGTDAFYIPRDDSIDPIFGDDPLASFSSYYPVEIYNNDTEDFEGQKEVFSKFGIEMKVEYTVMLARKTFLQRVAQNNNFNRPREGDLLWLPHVRGTGILYEITYCNPENDMMLMGRQQPYYWRLKLEPYKYSHNVMQTGLPEVDAIPGQDAYTISFQLTSANSSGQFIINEVVYQGPSLPSATSKAYVSYWDNPSLTLNVTNIMGVFATNANVIGSVSNAHYTLLSYDPLQDNLIREPFDNEFFKSEGDGYINFSEENPFGEP